jgi:hypothetical protein
MSDAKASARSAGGEIRITAPAAVLNNLEEFQRVQAEILGQSGCITCTSGYHLIWQTYNEFAVDGAGDVVAVRADNPQPSPWRLAGQER